MYLLQRSQQELLFRVCQSSWHIQLCHILLAIALDPRAHIVLNRKLAKLMMHSEITIRLTLHRDEVSLQVRINQFVQEKFRWSMATWHLVLKQPKQATITIYWTFQLPVRLYRVYCAVQDDRRRWLIKPIHQLARTLRYMLNQIDIQAFLGTLLDRIYKVDLVKQKLEPLTQIITHQIRMAEGLCCWLGTLSLKSEGHNSNW